MVQAKSDDVKIARLRGITLTNRQVVGFLLIVPSLCMLVLMVLAIGFNIVLGFCRYDLLKSSDITFIGITNFKWLLGNSLFRKAALNSVFFTTGSVSLEFLIGLALALLLNKKIKGESVFATLLAIPMMIAPVVATLQWKWLYSLDYGVVNQILQILGIKPVRWISDPAVAMYSVIIVEVWTMTPFVMLCLLAGLKSIPKDYYEAADIDGASRWKTFRYITLPLIKPVILVVLSIRFIDTFTKVFDIVYVLTGGGPANATEVLPIYAYRINFEFYQFGRGAAISIIMLIMSIALVLFFFKVLKVKMG